MRNRYRLRWREAVRGPSAPVASLPSVRMTDRPALALVGMTKEGVRRRECGQPNP